MIKGLTSVVAVLWFVVSVVIMQIEEPPVLPDGSFCTPAGIATTDGHVMDPAHPCHCEHMTTSTDCEGYVQENNRCTQYCHKDHCHCPVVCHPVDPVTGATVDPDDAGR